MLAKHIKEIAYSAREASRELARADPHTKDLALAKIAKILIEKQDEIIRENNKDCKKAKENGITGAKLDRLCLSQKVFDSMISGINDVIALPDPVGGISSMWRRPNGLQIGRMRIPLGVIGIIYESRPNVTVDAAVLCLKSGNAVILRGGSEAINSNLSLASVLRQALVETGLPASAIQVVDTTKREAVMELLKLEEFIDVIIPRGGEELIRFVTENSMIPVLKHYKGVCHVYVDDSADMDMAIDICFNSKVHRPGVCNAMETMLVHKNIANTFLLPMFERFKKVGVLIRGCPNTLKIIPNIEAAVEEDWPKEYLDLILAVKIVEDMDDAISHIAKYGSKHTEAIVTRDYERSQRFIREVDSSLVLINASTRFNDGNQLGLGAEIGISTSKLHAFGPMGLEELTSQKFICFGNGQVRE